MKGYGCTYIPILSEIYRTISFFRVYHATFPCIDQNFYSSLLIAPFSFKKTEPICLPREKEKKTRTFRLILPNLNGNGYLKKKKKRKKEGKRKIQCGQESTYIFFTG